MKDPEVPQPEQPTDVDHVVDSAKAGLDAAAAAGAAVPGESTEVADDAASVDAHADAPADAAADAPVDPDLAAFEEVERAYPGTFTASPPPAVVESETVVLAGPVADASYPVADAPYEPPIAESAYSAPPADAETHIVPSEPFVAAPAAPQPIFVQAPEPPRDRGNRGTAGAIGLLATVVFALLYLGAALGFGALAGAVTAENIGEAVLAPLTTWGFWTPVVVFFLGFWLLGAIINRGRWGHWVIFGVFVGLIAYGGHLLGQLFEAPFWKLSAAQGAELVEAQLFAPLAIAAFVFARELTIWFGAWVARSGARKTELNAEAQREYERTLEAGPTLSR